MPRARTSDRQALHQGRFAPHDPDDPAHQRRLEDARRRDRRHLLHLPSRTAGAGQRLVQRSWADRVTRRRGKSCRAECADRCGRLDVAALRSVHAFPKQTTAIRASSRRPRCLKAIVIRSSRPNGPMRLMMHISKALGVNCTFCHNSRSFTAWDQSTPQRATTWYGIRMMRDLNANYLESAECAISPSPLGPARRRSEGQLRYVPPGRLQAAVRSQHAEGLSGAPRPSGADTHASARNAWQHKVTTASGVACEWPECARRGNGCL